VRRILLAAALLLLSHSAWAQLSIDGTAQASYNSGTSIVSSGITTASTNDVIVTAVVSLMLSSAAPTVSSISGCGLTWAKRVSTGSHAMAGVLFGDVDVWWAKTSGTLSGCAVTANWTGSPANGDIVAWGVNGANIAAPFDANVSIPKTASSTSGTATPTITGVSTTAANTLLYAVNVNAVATGNPGSGYTTIVSSTLQDNQYKIVSVTQSGVTVAFGSGDQGGGYVMVADAIQKGSAGTPSNNFIFVPATVP